MIRITGGRFRGRRLAVPGGARPTSEMARKALFDILGPSVDGSRVLDAAAGSGAFGLEALSRGAREAVLVESSGAAARVVRDNVASLGVGESAVVVATSIHSYLQRRPDAPFDVVFHDPPYRTGADLDLPDLFDVLAPDGVLVHERGDETDPWPGGPRPADSRRYGGTRLLFYRR